MITSPPVAKAVFASAMANGGTYSFFPLIEQLQTQSEPAYCGLTTLVIVLNGESARYDIDYSSNAFSSIERRHVR